MPDMGTWNVPRAVAGVVVAGGGSSVGNPYAGQGSKCAVGISVVVVAVGAGGVSGGDSGVVVMVMLVQATCASQAETVVVALRRTFYRDGWMSSLILVVVVGAGRSWLRLLLIQFHPPPLAPKS